MFWSHPDFDGHEDVHFFTDRATGLQAIIAIHSTHLGPSSGGARYWRYANDADALTDALRLSRGMSYKNAMAGLPAGGGKGVILAGEGGKTGDQLRAFGEAIESLAGRYVTAEDVGMSEADMETHRLGHAPRLGTSGSDGQGGRQSRSVNGQGRLSRHPGCGRGEIGRIGHEGRPRRDPGVGSVGGDVGAAPGEGLGARLTLADANTEPGRGAGRRARRTGG